MPHSSLRPRWPRLALAASLAFAACKPAADHAAGAASASGASSAASPAASRAASGAAPGGGPASPILARADSGRIKGSASAPVWVIEISDFQCPYCKLWHDEVYASLVREFVETGKARLAYVHLPLNSHPNALPAAEASMCASAQGKFWEVQSAIFATQEVWAQLPEPGAHFDSLAARAGVGMGDWRECMRTDVTLPLIEADRERAMNIGVRSTPSFLVGGEAFSGVTSIERFREAIERASRAAPAPGR